MKAITFKYLVSLAAHEQLDMCLMDVITIYLYRNLDIYMKISKGFNMPETYKLNPKDIYSIKLQRSLYGFKQFGCIWYNCLSECLIK